MGNQPGHLSQPNLANSSSEEFGTAGGRAAAGYRANYVKEVDGRGAGKVTDNFIYIFTPTKCFFNASGEHDSRRQLQEQRPTAVSTAAA